ncbi:hypothetical protein [Clostridium beijerinckii]|uniref:hypothetical protein n=1 Tax=Clostridium beijerinckii TaxID=1520 RepID=UPI00156FA981|nr:hypothetical protein [Clostridium beijerinckii]NRW83832.1 chemotaxis protein histidine kinase CheA [Clostridium beijerinckii]
MDSAKDISLVSHSFETLLTIIRDRNLNFKKENIDLSYEVVDYLKACISVISGISEVVIPAQAIREKINKEIESLSNDLLYSVKECSEKKNIKINNESNSDVNDEVLKKH